ncbi:unnamed protein product, partial [Thlaspi arvense]
LFGNHEEEDLDEDLVVVIDAPRLEKLKLFDPKTDCFIINSIGSLVKAVIDVTFNLYQFDPIDLPKRNMIRSFLLAISSAREMTITSFTLEAIYNYSRCEPLPLFRNLSSLRANFYNCTWETLPIFLESCPTLKSLSFSIRDFEEPIGILLGLPSFLPSLEFVEIVSTMINAEEHMKLVSYFLENSTILKKLVRGCERLDILKKLLSTPRLSSSCQVIVL